MGSQFNKVFVAKCILNFTAIMCMLSFRVSQGRYTVEREGVVKTIVGEHGDVIDCFDIYKQPSLGHPLVGDIQMKPSSYPTGMKAGSLEAKLIQSWHKSGRCPEGTVPIRRNSTNHSHRKSPSSLRGTLFNQNELDAVDYSTHEYAAVDTTGNNNYYGSHASISLWNPSVGMGNEFSLSQLWLVSNSQQGLNTIEAGWMVSPQILGDSKTRFFIYWTADGYGQTGCYNLNCPGFVQTNGGFAIGSAFEGISTFDGQKMELEITVFKDKDGGNWWLMVDGKEIGYWPASLYTSLADSASRASWGGEIINTRSEGHHTSTQMGSGHFPSEGHNRASYFRNVQIVDNTNTLRDPGQLQPLVTNSQCYDLQLVSTNQDSSGIRFYYGGSGYSATCP